MPHPCVSDLSEYLKNFLQETNDFFRLICYSLHI
jgi:hypothetical protein